MRRILSAVFLALAFASSAIAAPDKYTFDKDHTHILFFVSHEGFSDTVGRMDAFDGHFTFDEKEPEASEIEVTIKSDSVDTGVTALDKVLRAEKFLNADAFPSLHFKSTGVAITGSRSGDITGDLTLLGVTKPVVLHVKYNRSGVHPLTNNYVSGFSADAAFQRSDFGMNAYPHDIGDTVRIHIEAEGADPLRHPGNSKAPH